MRHHDYLLDLFHITAPLKKALEIKCVQYQSIVDDISVLTYLLDFGFNNSFVRTVTYIFSGCTTLKRSGYETLDCDSPVDYSLLKGVIKAMQWFYKRAAAALFLLLVCAGTPYLLSVLENYPAIRNEVLLAWAIFIVLMCRGHRRVCGQAHAVLSWPKPAT